ncbi:hypothetical protein HRbin13_00884 [bacterium HR13]|nr:hypothetical protein HRbin13_00884 [bacterium HR13]
MHILGSWVHRVKLTCGLYFLHHFLTHNSLCVVGDDNAIHLKVQPFQNLLKYSVFSGIFVLSVYPYELLGHRYDPDLLRCRSATVSYRQVMYIPLPQKSFYHVHPVIFSGDTYQISFYPQSGEVARHIARPSQSELFPLYFHHRHRCLGRYALHLAKHIPVKYHIPHHKYF